MITLTSRLSRLDEEHAGINSDPRNDTVCVDTCLLVAHPDEILRRGHCAVLKEELMSASVHEARSYEEFLAALRQRIFDLIVFHQSFFVPDIKLPCGRFALIATEPTIEAYVFARSKGALAYLSENASPSLLQQMLRLSPGAFLIGPLIASWLQDYMAQRLFLTLDVSRLTPREQEIFDLYWRGANHQAIAQQLCIAESTVRSHLSHINENLSLNRNQATALSKQLSREKQER